LTEFSPDLNLKCLKSAFYDRLFPNAERGLENRWAEMSQEFESPSLLQNFPTY